MQMESSRTSQMKREQDDLLRAQASTLNTAETQTKGSLLQNKVALENKVNTQLGKVKLAADSLDEKYLELVEGYKKVISGPGDMDTWKEAKIEVDAAKDKLAAHFSTFVTNLEARKIEIGALANIEALALSRDNLKEDMANLFNATAHKEWLQLSAAFRKNLSSTRRETAAP